jgi:hypothetical protein
MKKLAIYVFLAIIALSARIEASAQCKIIQNSDHQVVLRVNPDKKVMFNADLLKGQKRLHYVLSIYSESGDKVFGETFIGKKQINKLYNISSLPEGKYVFDISHKLKRVCQMDVYNKVDPNQGIDPLVVQKK